MTRQVSSERIDGQTQCQFQPNRYSLVLDLHPTVIIVLETMLVSQHQHTQFHFLSGNRAESG